VVQFDAVAAIPQGGIAKWRRKAASTSNDPLPLPPGQAGTVTFNGVKALFTQFSNGLIEARVPVGAETGPVEVTTPYGTLSSNVPFQVDHSASPESAGGEGGVD
jgi:uncharacterized protein (TIGR03437 family)